MDGKSLEKERGCHVDSNGTATLILGRLFHGLSGY